MVFVAYLADMTDVLVSLHSGEKVNIASANTTLSEICLQNLKYKNSSLLSFTLN